MPLAAPARSAGSSWTRPSTALSFPGWATTASPKSATLWVSYRCRPIGQQSIVLQRPLESTGYASEAAAAAMRSGFEDLRLEEIVAVTVPANVRSQQVMRRLGMTYSAADDFDHPRLPQDDPLRRHVLFRMSRQDWLRRT
jgi:Acetyltransferase (GNAT) domain